MRWVRIGDLSDRAAAPSGPQKISEHTGKTGRCYATVTATGAAPDYYFPPMPVISYFFGIYVRMYHDDHPPPHVHVEYQGHEAFVDISSGEVLEGQLPRNAARLVKDWCLEHRAELAANWTRAQALEPLERIPGADQ